MLLEEMTHPALTVLDRDDERTDVHGIGSYATEAGGGLPTKHELACYCGHRTDWYATGREAFDALVSHATAEDGDIVAEIQRELGITIAAQEAAEARGETPPLSGMPGFEEWRRSVLRAAGETYQILRGERVPLS